MTTNIHSFFSVHLSCHAYVDIVSWLVQHSMQAVVEVQTLYNRWSFNKRLLLPNMFYMYNALHLALVNSVSSLLPGMTPLQKV